MSVTHDINLTFVQPTFESGRQHVPPRATNSSCSSFYVHVPTCHPVSLALGRSTHLSTFIQKRQAPLMTILSCLSPTTSHQGTCEQFMHAHITITFTQTLMSSSTSLPRMHTCTHTPHQRHGKFTVGELLRLCGSGICGNVRAGIHKCIIPELHTRT
jgi:hypothetical protein